MSNTYIINQPTVRRREFPLQEENPGSRRRPGKAKRFQFQPRRACLSIVSYFARTFTCERKLSGIDNSVLAIGKVVFVVFL